MKPEQLDVCRGWHGVARRREEKGDAWPGEEGESAWSSEEKRESEREREEKEEEKEEKKGKEKREARTGLLSILIAVILVVRQVLAAQRHRQPPRRLLQGDFLHLLRAPRTRSELQKEEARKPKACEASGGNRARGDRTCRSWKWVPARILQTQSVSGAKGKHKLEPLCHLLPALSLTPSPLA